MRILVKPTHQVAEGVRTRRRVNDVRLDADPKVAGAIPITEEQVQRQREHEWWLWHDVSPASLADGKV